MIKLFILFGIECFTFITGLVFVQRLLLILSLFWLATQANYLLYALVPILLTDCPYIVKLYFITLDLI